jgi:hypothetical protein
MKPHRRKRAPKPEPKRKVTLIVRYVATPDWKDRLRRVLAAVAPDQEGERGTQEDRGPRPAA